MAARQFIYKYHHIYHVVLGVIINLSFFTEDLYGARDTVNIFLFPNISLSEVLEAELEAQRWDTELDISILITYSNTSVLLKENMVAPTVVWEASFSML